MEMLSSIKKTLRNITKNVGILHLDESNNNVIKHVNIDAGFDVLRYYQKNWKALHDANEYNAQKADEASKHIEDISSKVKRDKENYTHMIQMLTSNFRTTIHNSAQQISEIYKHCEVVEAGLLELENLIEQVELEQKKKEHLHNLERYKLRKLDNLEKVKASLEENYQKAVEHHELMQRNLLQERQKVFQDAFKSDLELYKNLGTVPKLDLPKKQSALLEEIQLDYDENELEQFFEDDTQTK